MSTTKHGQICHIEIPAPNLQKAVDFYTKVFGWSTEQSGDKYVMFNDGGICGGFDATLTPGSGPNTVIAVDDIQATLTAIAKAGGLQLSPKIDIAPHGFVANVADPLGNRFSIWCKQ